MLCTSLGASAPKVSPAQLCQGNRGWCWLCCAGMGEGASSSNASGSRALLAQVQAAHISTAPAHTGLGLIQRCQPRLGQIPHPWGPCLSTLCSVQGTTFTYHETVHFLLLFTGHLLVVPSMFIHRCHCRSLFMFYCYGVFNISFYFILFKYFSIHLSFMNASINNETKELSNIILD